MAQKWRDQLKSDDPKVRAEAVKQLALTGDHDNLQYLKEIAENDPNPQLREYAKKAARHLYTSPPKKAPETSMPIPVEPIENGTADITHQEGSEDSISKADQKAAQDMVQRAFSLHTKEATHKAIPILSQALEMNPGLEKDTFTRSVAAELTGKTPEQALYILKDPSDRQELINEIRGKAKKGRKAPSPSPRTGTEEHRQTSKAPSGLVQIWLNYFSMTERFIGQVIEQANSEDTLLSVLVYTIAAVTMSMISWFTQLQQLTELIGDQFPNIGSLFMIILVVTAVMTPIGFYFSVGLQFLGMRIFGGIGTFKVHAYILALILVPATILNGVVAIVAIVPFIGLVAGLAAFGLSIYSIILTVRAAKVVHDVSTGRAIAGIIIPPFILVAIGGCLLMTVGAGLVQTLTQLQ